MTWLNLQKQKRGTAECGCEKEQESCDCSPAQKRGCKSPASFKGANSSNSECWDTKVKIGTKPSPTRPGVRVNDCVDPSDPRAKNKR